MDFVVSTESVNKYGYRVLTEGIDTSEFEKNPLMFYNHDRWGKLPIGRWENLRKENNKLVATAVFDDDDEFAQKVKNKVEKRILNACSMGFDAKELSDDASLLLPGQKRATVTKSILHEISIVDLPGNGDAMRLKMPNKMLVLGAGIEDENVSQLPIIQRKEDMKKIALALGLPETATEEQAIERIESLHADRAVAIQLLGGLGEQAGLSKESLLRLAERDFAETLKLVQAKVPNQEQEGQGEEEQTHPFAQLSAVIEKLSKSQSAPQGQQEQQGESLREMERRDPDAVRSLILNSPEQYKKLYKAQYGKELSEESLSSIAKMVG